MELILTRLCRGYISSQLNTIVISLVTWLLVYVTRLRPFKVVCDGLKIETIRVFIITGKVGYFTTTDPVIFTHSQPADNWSIWVFITIYSSLINCSYS